MSIDKEDESYWVSEYEKKYAQFGYNPSSLGWSKGKQEIRFEVLSSMFDMGYKSFLDIGCGFGDYVYYLENMYKNEKNGGFSYYGVDLVKSFIDEAKKRTRKKSNVWFEQINFLDLNSPMSADYAIASGIFNFKFDNTDNYKYIEAVMKKAFDCASEAIAFDFLSDKVDYELEHTFHSSPSAILEMAYQLSRNVVLRNDYMPFEFAVFVFKDDSFEKKDTVFNRFKAGHRLKQQKQGNLQNERG